MFMSVQYLKVNLIDAYACKYQVREFFLNEKSPMALNILHVDYLHNWSHGTTQAGNDILNLNITIWIRNR